MYYIFIHNFTGGQAQANYIDRKMRELVKKAPKKIIVDVATNPGGDIGIAQRFMSYLLNRKTRFGARIRATRNLWKPPQSFDWTSNELRKGFETIYRTVRRLPKKGSQFSGEIFRRSFGNRSHTPDIVVVVGPGTRSAATIMATTLKRIGGAKISGKIGDVSSKTACIEAPGSHVLPKTKVKVKIPLICYDRETSKSPDSEFLTSDLPIDLVITSSSFLLEKSLWRAREAR